MRGVRTETCPRWPSPAAEPGNHRASIRGRAAALRSGSRVCILRWHRVLTPTLWPRVSSSPWRGHVSSPRGGEVHVNPACESWVGVRRRMFFLGTHTTQIVCQKKKHPPGHSNQILHAGFAWTSPPQGQFLARAVNIRGRALDELSRNRCRRTCIENAAAYSTPVLKGKPALEN